MPFVSHAMNDVREPEAAPEDQYDLRIVKAERKTSKKGRDMIVATMVIQDSSVDAPPFQLYLLAPGPDDDDNQVRMRLLEIKRFCSVFDLDPENFDEQDLVGQTGSCFVTQETGEDNVVRNRLRLPRLKD